MVGGGRWTRWPAVPALAVVGAVAAVLTLSGAASAPRFPAGSKLIATTAGGATVLSWSEAVPPTRGAPVTYRITVDGAEFAKVSLPAASCHLAGFPSGAHHVAVAAYSSNRQLSGRLTTRVTGPSGEQGAKGCRPSGVTDPAALTRRWREITLRMPSGGDTGTTSPCRAGTTSSAFRATALKKLNAYRALAGVGPVKESASHTASAQAAALMLAANQSLSHKPPTSWACYTSLGAEGAATSNIAQGDPDPMRGFIADPGASNAQVGHRRWLLCPGTTTVGIGRVTLKSGRLNGYPFDAVRVLPSGRFDGRAAREGLIAWPNPGVVPYGITHPVGLLDRFSVTVPTGHDVGQARITVKSSKGGTVAVTQLVRGEGACAPTLVWRPGRAPSAGETWTIVASNIADDQGVTYSRIWATTFASRF